MTTAGQHFLLDTGTLFVLGYYRDIPAVRIWNAPTSEFIFMTSRKNRPILMLASSPYAKRGELYGAYRRHFGKDDAPTGPIHLGQAFTTF